MRDRLDTPAGALPQGGLMTKYLDVLLARGPGPSSDFIELEDDERRGVGSPRAEWIDRDDGYTVLRIHLEDAVQYKRGWIHAMQSVMTFDGMVIETSLPPGAVGPLLATMRNKILARMRADPRLKG